MKRRDFITKSTLGAAGATALMTGISAEAGTKDALSTQEIATQQDASSPVVEVMKNADKSRSGIHIGGIGSGGAELRKDGIFYNWNIANNNPRGTGEFLSNFEHFKVQKGRKGHKTFYTWEDDEALFFLVRYQAKDKNPIFKILQIEDGTTVGNIEQHIYMHPWLSGIDKIEYMARFPFAKLKFTDPELPLEITLEAYSPFIPNDVKNSSLPCLYFNFEINHIGNTDADVMIIASMRSQVGYDIENKIHTSKVTKGKGYVMTTLSADKLDIKASSYGQMTLASLSDESTYHVGWEHRHPYYEMLMTEKSFKNIDDTEGRNYLKDENGNPKGQTKIFTSVALSKTMSQGATLSHAFVMSWNFPNMYDIENKTIPGHYYSNFFNHSEEAALYAISNQTELYKKSKEFLAQYYESTLPTYVLDQINSQLNTFITSSYLAKDKKFGILEGLSWNQSWAGLCTTDVDMYGGVMIRSLFMELQIEAMRAHKALQAENGEIAHSIKKGFGDMEKNIAGVSHRLDLAPQYVTKVATDYFWTGDKELLKEFWPSMKKTMEYMLKERDVNGDMQPDMTGIMCSYDNFPMYGLASYVHTQWLSALVGSLACAAAIGDKEFLKKFGPVYEKGAELAEQKLWNGKYYRLYNSDLNKMKTKDGSGKEVEKDMSGVDEGCLTDQIIGQWATHQMGMGYILDRRNVRLALKEIMNMSYRDGFGLRNCSWPGYDFYQPVPADIWVDQGNTCWSGVELSFASFLMYEGLVEDALKVIKTVDDRYRKCGRYWDHQEFGGHYFRPMGAWGILNGALGLAINQGVFSFYPKFKEKTFKLYFSFPKGTAHFVSNNGKLSIQVLTGECLLSGIRLMNTNIVKGAKMSIAGTSATATIDGDGYIYFDFKKKVTVKAGQTIVIS